MNKIQPQFHFSQRAFQVLAVASTEAHLSHICSGPHINFQFLKPPFSVDSRRLAMAKSCGWCHKIRAK